MGKNDTPYFLHPNRKQYVNSYVIDSGVYGEYARDKLAQERHEIVEEKVTFGGYLKYLRELKDSPFDSYKKIDFYMTYDRHPEHFKAASDANFKKLRDLEGAGFNPIPVIHDHVDDPKKYIGNKKYPLVCIGSAMLRNVGDAGHLINALHANNQKVHCLGQPFYDLAYYPVSSCDSAMWATEGMKGRIYWWNELQDHKDENKTCMIYFPKKEQEKVGRLCGRPWSDRSKFGDPLSYSNNQFPQHYKDGLSEYLKIFNLEVEELFEANVGTEASKNRQLINLYFFGVVLQEKITEAHRQRGFDTDW